MADKLLDLIQQLQQSNPQLIEGLEKAAAAGLQQDKLAVYAIFVKDNKAFTYDALDKVLSRHENSRLDINWNKGEYIYRIVLSRRKRLPEKPEKEKKTDATKPTTENKSAINQ